MTSLNFNIHNSNEVSIMDLNRNLDVSDVKWDLLINYFFKKSEVTYFYGLRLNYSYPELKKDVEYLSEEELFNEGNSNRVFFRVKSANVILNRTLLSKLWKTYEAPCLVFSDREHSQASIKIFYLKTFIILSCYRMLAEYL